MPDQQVETPKFSPVEYQQKANEAEAARRNGAPLVPPVKEPEKPKEVAKPADDDGEDTEKRRSRSERRRLKAFEEAAEWKGRYETLQAVFDKMGTKSEPSPPTGTDDPEPQRSAYSSDRDYDRALGRWDARQESTKVVEKHTQTAEQRAALMAKVSTASAKFNEDIVNFGDWEELRAATEKKHQEAIDNDEETAGIIEGSNLQWLTLTSKHQAAMVYHWAKNPQVLEELAAIKDESEQIEAFRQLEGEVKVLYSPKQAAQAQKETSKDRTHPAEEKSGRNSVERDAHKPRPSTEVAARGGSAPPGDLRIGSPEWHERANRREQEMRGR